MNEILHRLTRQGDPLQLYTPDMVERIPKVVELKSQFQDLIPERFSPSRVFISPLKNSEHVLRSNCTNKDCGIRVTTHIKRENGDWSFTDIDPDGTVKLSYSREDNSPCADCQTLLATLKQS